MGLTEKYKIYIIGLISLIVVVLLLLWIGEIILPFILAIFIAYLLNPTILNFQKKIRNKNLAISCFLFLVTIIFVGILFFFGSHIVRDSTRLVNGVKIFAEENKEQIIATKKSVMVFAEGVYENEAVKKQIANLDSLAKEGGGDLDLAAAIGSVYSFFDDSDNTEEIPEAKSWSPFFMILNTILYAVFIIFTYQYFEKKYAKYFGGRDLTNNLFGGIWRDFENVFIIYFRQRSKVILINFVILVGAFTILDLPGAIIIGCITALLSYASHFHYLSLPLVGIGCWVLSVENGYSFFIYFGIVMAIYILISILEETVYFDKIMNSVNGMNPAIMMLSLTLSIYIFGGFVGTIIALPFTQLILILMDRMILYSRDNLIVG